MNTRRLQDLEGALSPGKCSHPKVTVSEGCRQRGARACDTRQETWTVASGADDFTDFFWPYYVKLEGSRLVPRK